MALKISESELLRMGQRLSQIKGEIIQEMNSIQEQANTVKDNIKKGNADGKDIRNIISEIAFNIEGYKGNLEEFLELIIQYLTEKSKNYGALQTDANEQLTKVNELIDGISFE